MRNGSGAGPTSPATRECNPILLLWGDVGAVDFVAARDAQWLVRFDLGIYEPTAFAWEVISAHQEPRTSSNSTKRLTATNDAY